MNQNITELLIELREGEDEAIEKLFPLVYEEMRSIAGFQIGKEYNSITFQQTELVHEAFMKMADQTRIKAIDRNHFYNIAARCMRQILVDHARKKHADKRGGNNHQVTLNERVLKQEEHLENIIEIDRHLEALKAFDERMAKVVELRFFGGLTNENIGEVLGISPKTVSRDWMHAKGWLFKKIKESD